jgi:hypothetical protein
LLAACGPDPLADAQSIVLEGYGSVKAPADWACKVQYEDELLCQPPDPSQAVFKMMPLTDLVPGGAVDQASLGAAILDYWPAELIGQPDEITSATVGGMDAFRTCVETQSGFHCCAVAAGKAEAPVFIPHCALKEQDRAYQRTFKAMLAALEF